MAVPSHFALQFDFNKKFLCLPDEVKRRRPRGYLQFSGENAYGERSQQELERSKSDGGLVHVRSLYNNRYWERLDDGWISATAEKTEEDKTKMSCTLFKPTYVNNTLRIQHVQSGFYTCVWTVPGPLNSCLCAAADSDNDEPSFTAFTIIDLEQMFIIPRYVAFKGDNHKYLRFFNTSQGSHFRFDSEDVAHDDVANEVCKNPDGTIRVKVVLLDKFWTGDSSGRMLAYGSDNKKNNDLFSTFKVDDDVVALRNLGNNLFCKRSTSRGYEVFFNVTNLYIDMTTKLRVEETVLSRKIYNVKFRINDARIYNKIDVVIAANATINNTDKPTNLDVKFSYADSKTSSTWKSIASTKLKNVPTTLESSIPQVKNGMIQVSGHFQEAYQWGVTREWKTPIRSYDVSFSVPPMTKVAVKVIATICSYDVPFSYTQRDVPMNGNIEVEDMDDGKYTGTGYSSIKYVTTEEKLQDYEDPLAQ